MVDIPIYVALAVGSLMILTASITMLVKKTLTPTELIFAALGLVLVAGPSFLSSFKLGKDGFEIVGRLASNNHQVIEALAKKIDLVSARVDTLLPPDLKSTSGKVVTSKEWLDILKAQPQDKRQETCQKYPYLCIQKLGGFLINDQKVIDLFGDFKALNESNSKIQVLMQESNDIKNALEKKKGIERLG